MCKYFKLCIKTYTVLIYIKLQNYQRLDPIMMLSYVKSGHKIKGHIGEENGDRDVMMSDGDLGLSGYKDWRWMLSEEEGTGGVVVD